MQEQLLYSNKNLKITLRARSIILNMQSATDCISKLLGLCQLQDCSSCYAFRSEQRYKHCLPFRRKQALQWLYQDEKWYIEKIAGVQKRAINKYNFIRFSESGDFNSLQDFYKMQAIARGINSLNGVKLGAYVYTARYDLFEGIQKSELKHSPLVVNGSNFMLDNMFKVVGKGYTLKRGEVRCRGLCEACNYCKVKGKKVIVNELH